MTPSSAVPKQPSGSRPGISRRASAPATNPISSHPMMIMCSPSSCPAVARGPLGPAYVSFARTTGSAGLLGQQAQGGGLVVVAGADPGVAGAGGHAMGQAEAVGVDVPDGGVAAEVAPGAHLVVEVVIGEVDQQAGVLPF